MRRPAKRHDHSGSTDHTGAQAETLCGSAWALLLGRLSGTGPRLIDSAPPPHLSLRD